MQLGSSSIYSIRRNVWFLLLPLITFLNMIVIIKFQTSEIVERFIEFTYMIFLTSFFEGLKSPYLRNIEDRRQEFINITIPQIGIQLLVIIFIFRTTNIFEISVFLIINSLCGVRLFCKYDYSPTEEIYYLTIGALLRTLPVFILIYFISHFHQLILLFILGRCVELAFYLHILKFSISKYKYIPDFRKYATLIKFSSDRWFGWFRNYFLLHVWVPTLTFDDQLAFFFFKKITDTICDGPNRFIENRVANNEWKIAKPFLVILVLVFVVGLSFEVCSQVISLPIGNFHVLGLMFLYVSQATLVIFHYSSLRKSQRFFYSLVFSALYIAVLQFSDDFLITLTLLAIIIALMVSTAYIVKNDK